MPECTNYRTNLENCTCGYEGCPRKGKCCECLSYHLADHELPACCFPPDVAQTNERSFQRFASRYST
jgi:hypothetical protein